MAAVFCASFRRRAIVCRSLVMRDALFRARASVWGGACRGADGEAGRAAAGAGAGARAAAMTSPFRTWPRLPDPSTVARSIPFSAAILAAEGAGGMVPDAAPAADLGADAPLVAGAGDTAAAPAEPEIWPRTAPGVTVDPVSTPIEASTPDAGALTSNVTLSVSSSTRGSSRLDAVAGLLEPLGDRGLADRLAEGRHLDVGAVSSRRGRRGSRIGMVAVTGPGLDTLDGGCRGLRRLGLGGLALGRFTLDGLAPGRRRSARPSGRDLAQQGPGRHRLAVLDDDLAQHAGRGRVDFQRDLVGLQLADGLVGLHGIARLLEPAADGGLADRFAEGWNANLSRHGSVAPLAGAAAPLCSMVESAPRPGTRMSRLQTLRDVQLAKTSSMKALSWARCFDIRPVAVAAAAGRPA